MPVDDHNFPVQLKENQTRRINDKDLRRKIKNAPLYFQKNKTRNYFLESIINTILRQSC